MTLDEKIKAIASEAFYDGNACGGEIPKWLINAIYAGIRAFAEPLERENVALKTLVEELEERLNAVEDDIQHRIDE